MSTPTSPHQSRSFTRESILAIIAFSLCVAIISCVMEDDLTADQRVHQLSQQLMCPVCDGQTLDQSQAQLSEDMKAVIRTKIEEGATNTEIRAYFVERYGEIVLASPDAGGFNLIAWVMPAAIFLGGALLVGNAYMNMRKRRRGDDNEEKRDRVEAVLVKPEPELDEYLERADREMASALGGSSLSPDTADEKGDKG